MIAVLSETNHYLPAAKRQKCSVSPSPPLFIDASSSLGGIEDEYDDDFEYEEEDSPQMLNREDALLDRVLSVYEQYEEDSLVKQSRFRAKMTACGLAKSRTFKKKLQDEKIKCNLFKVLTLLLQSRSRLRGHTHEDRVELIRQVKQALLDEEVYSVEELKGRFTLLFAVLRRDMFPPCSILVPSTTESTASLKVDQKPASPPLTQKKLNQQTERWRTRLQEAAKDSLQERLSQGDWQQSNDQEESWESMRDVWHVWLQFPAKSAAQLGIWQETLQHGGNLNSLLWNLAFYLSMEGRICVD